MLDGMQIQESRVLVVGATGVLGGVLARALVSRGARVALAGRDAERLAALGGELDAPTLAFDAYDLDGAAALPAAAREALGGLEGVVVAAGAVAFGPTDDTGEEIAEHLFTVNALAPIAVLRSALPLLEKGGAVAAITGVVAERPMAGMAAYSASKAALGAWLTAARTEQRRRGVGVLEAVLPHMDTGLVDRAIAGTPPKLPAGEDVDAVIARVLDAWEAGERQVH